MREKQDGQTHNIATTAKRDDDQNKKESTKKGVEVSIWQTNKGEC